MKRILVTMMVLSLLLAAAAAHAEVVLPEDAMIPMGVERSADLDGDGAPETLLCTLDETDYDTPLTVTVTGAAGTATYATDILSYASAYLVDLDGDGLTEVLVTGDEMSDDYCTYCLRWQDGLLYEVLFPDASRSDENRDCWFRSGYGLITAVDGNRLTLTGTQDVLGTWMASRDVTLASTGRFEFCDDGVWLRDLGNMNDDIWEYATLTLTAPLSYVDQYGQTGELAPGDRILIYASDKREYAWFATPDGITGVLAISPDYERGWGWLIEGRSESECFEYIPYAD